MVPFWYMECATQVVSGWFWEHTSVLQLSCVLERCVVRPIDAAFCGQQIPVLSIHKY